MPCRGSAQGRWVRKVYGPGRPLSRRNRSGVLPQESALRVLHVIRSFRRMLAGPTDEGEV